MSCANHIRFTATEMEEFQRVGLDFHAAETPHEITRIIREWVEALGKATVKIDHRGI